MLDLKNTTLFSIAWGDKISPTKIAMDHCCKQCNFGDVQLITSVVDNEIGYNKFIVEHLNETIKTEFCLVMQWDGFIIDTEEWDDIFFQYDYIGAVWHFEDCKNNVGNGGFSLRSKRFLELSSGIKYDYDKISWHSSDQSKDRPVAPEDWFLCYDKYDYMIENKIKFAPISIANRFSVEKNGYNNQHNLDDISTYCSFGFHGSHNVAAMELLEK
tara:strand:+ start:1153 stop:1794 length:642 start_codon:yes stop_codon:yes gene_type:complete